MRFAGLAGYVISKAAAASSRGWPKDYYDFVYVLLYNDAGGPREAAEAIRTGPTAGLWTDYERALREAVRACDTTASPGSLAFASEMRRSGSEDEDAVLLQDAVGAVTEFSDMLWETSWPSAQVPLPRRQHSAQGMFSVPPLAAGAKLGDSDEREVVIMRYGDVADPDAQVLPPRFGQLPTAVRIADTSTAQDVGSLPPTVCWGWPLGASIGNDENAGGGDSD